MSLQFSDLAGVSWGVLFILAGLILRSGNQPAIRVQLTLLHVPLNVWVEHILLVRTEMQGHN